MTDGVRLGIARLPHAAGIALPEYRTEGSAGLDLAAAVPEDTPVLIAPGSRALVPTGLTLAIAPGYEGQIRPRSGLALKHGLTVLNSPGTIDADYRGEVQILLVNLGPEPVEITRGMRVAQLVIAPVVQARIDVVEDPTLLGATTRAGGGFGSTGHR